MTGLPFHQKGGRKLRMSCRTSMPSTNQHRIRKIPSRYSGSTFINLFCLVSFAAAQITGPTKCPEAEDLMGYSDLTTLKLDIAIASNETEQAEGGSYVLCPETVFSFTVPPPDDDVFVDDDILGPPTVDAEPLVIDANSTQIFCGEDGSSSNNCIFFEGAFQIVIVGEPTGVLVSGLTFSQAKNASIVYSGAGGDMSFRDCIWNENSGNGVILSVFRDATPTPSILPSQSIQPTLLGSISSSPSESQIPTAPSVSSNPSLSIQPSISPSASFSPSESQIPTAPSVSLNPSMSIQPTSAGSISVSPSESQIPTAPSVSLSPSLSTQPSLLGSTSLSPSVSQFPTAPSVSSNPSLSIQPTSTGSTSSSPSESQIPTAPSVSLSPSLSTQPSLLGSTSLSPSVSQFPTAPSVSSNPSLSIQPTSTGSTSSSPSVSQLPTAPSVSLAPSASIQPTLLGSTSSSPSVSLSPSISIQPSLSPSESQVPTSPSVSLNPSVSLSPSMSIQPSISPSASFSPSESQIPTAPSVSLNPSLSIQPSSSNQGRSCPEVPSNGCEICGPGKCVTSPDNQITFPDSPPFPCGDLEAAGLAGDIAIDQCDFLPALVGEACDCDSSLPAPSAADDTSRKLTNSIQINLPTIFDSKDFLSEFNMYRPLTKDNIAISNDQNGNFMYLDLVKAVYEQSEDHLYHMNSRQLQSTQSFILTLENCAITENNVDTAAVLVLGGQLNLINCEFTENAASGSVVSVVSGGELSMQSTVFVGNDFQFFPAPVFLDITSTLSENADSCGDNGSECEGVFVQTGGDCTNPDTCEGDCNEFTSNECVSNFCYDEWSELVQAVEESSEMGEGKEFKICNNTILAVEERMVISQSSTRILCGDDGSRINNCTVFGGSRQIEVTGSAEDVSLTGITFVSSTLVAFSASGNVESSAILRDCEFNGNSGRAAVELYNGGLDDSADELESIDDPPGEGMTLIAVSCTFIDNEVSFSPVANFNGITAFDQTLFNGNSGEAGAIMLRGGQISITGSCFLSSLSSGLPGIIFLDQDSISLQNSDNFGSQNMAIDEPNCIEMFIETDGSCIEDPDQCNGDCEAFSSQECSLLPPSPSPTNMPSEAPSISPTETPSLFPSQTPSLSPSLSVLPSSAGCLRSWDQLYTAIKDVDNNGGTFTICPNTVMNVDSEQDETPIVIDSNNVIVQCGATGARDNRCAIFGGENHFQIDGGSSNIQFLGLRFIGALETSINAFGNSDANARFVDCEWMEGIGPQQILVDGRENGSMSVEFDDCLFRKNTSSDSTIKNIGGFLSLSTTLLDENEAENGIISLSTNGVLSLRDNCFVSNVVEKDQGIIVVGEGSTVNARDNFGRGNSVGENNICTAILDVDEETCTDFDAMECVNYDLSPTGFPTELPSFLPTQVPTIAPIDGTLMPTPIGPEPTEFPTGFNSPGPTFGCFSRWDRLSLAVLRACSEGVGGVFTLCPNTNFDVDEYPDPLVSPIVVHSSDIKIQCGDDGARDKNCVISGGVTQFKLRNTIIGVEFKGLTFEKSRGMSINAAATGDSMAVFVDCEWRENEGSSAISMIEMNRAEKAMMIGVRRSDFTENSVVDAVILNDGGSLVVEECLFQDNSASKGAIYVLKEGKVSVIDSCYVRNEGGAVSLNDSSLERDEGNFGFGNGMCNGILEEDNMDLVMCGRACVVFEEDECAVMEFDPDEIPTASPTVTFQPNCVPTTSPYPSLSPTEILSPTINPTLAPSVEPASEPTQEPEENPTSEPTEEPTEQPTQEPSVEPSDSPTKTGSTNPPTITTSIAPSIPCFSQWDQLSLAMSVACAEDTGGSFVICPDTYFDLDEFSDSLITPIVICSSDVTVQCGDDGARSNNCVISGGETQFKLRSVIVGIAFKGLTFQQSRGMSVFAGATMDSMASLIDCEWRNHEGSSVVTMTELDNNGTAMMLALRNCNFTDNTVTDATVVNTGGKLFVEETVFLRNEANRGAIDVAEGGGITLLDSCFVQNIGGAVGLEESMLIRNDGNFGFANEKCNGVLDLDDSIEIICGGACTVFEENECAVMDFDIEEIPTQSPTIAPPNCIPTTSPSHTPTVTANPTKDNTESPSSGLLPTNEPTDTTINPTLRPSDTPTGVEPTLEPTNSPSGVEPSDNPTNNPSGIVPTPDPSQIPTNLRTDSPTKQPGPSSNPTTHSPTVQPEPQTSRPSSSPSRLRTSRPTITPRPSSKPSMQMDTTFSPTHSEQPTPFDTDMSFSLDYNFFYKFH